MQNGGENFINQGLHEQFSILKTFIYNSTVVQQLTEFIIVGYLNIKRDAFNPPTVQVSIFEEGDSPQPEFAKSILSLCSLQYEIVKIIHTETLKYLDRYSEDLNPSALYIAMKKDRAVYKIKRKTLRAIRYKLKLDQIKRVTLPEYEGELF